MDHEDKNILQGGRIEKLGMSLIPDAEKYDVWLSQPLISSQIFLFIFCPQYVS